MRILILSLLVIFASCKNGPSDKEIEQDIRTKISTTAPDVVPTVNNGVVTLSGTCADEPCKQSSESSAKSAKGVKQVVNNITVNTPPAAAPTVEINTTDSLQTSLDHLLTAYKSVKGTVDSGVVTLTGSVKRSQLTPLMQSVHELKPKKVVNKLEIK
jgi:hyperosmotically inducible protein